MAQMTSPRAQNGALVNGNPVSALVAAIVGWKDTRATQKALSVLTDRELDDIGLVRGDIDVIAGR